MEKTNLMFGNMTVKHCFEQFQINQFDLNETFWLQQHIPVLFINNNIVIINGVINVIVRTKKKK